MFVSIDDIIMVVVSAMLGVIAWQNRMLEAHIKFNQKLLNDCLAEKRKSKTPDDERS